MSDFSKLTFVEIGAPWIKTAFPNQTECFSTYHTGRTADPDNGIYAASLGTLAQLRKALSAPDLSLVVCRPLFYPPWHWQWLTRELFSRRALQGQSRLGSAWAAQLLRLPIAAPIAVLDTEDYPAINPDRLFLLSRCRVYFKRELPPDRWRLLMGTAHSSLPSRRFRQQSRYRNDLAKICPLPLGLPREAESLLPQTPQEKSTDVFFAGDTEHSSTVRASGIGE